MQRSLTASCSVDSVRKISSVALYQDIVSLIGQLSRQGLIRLAADGALDNPYSAQTKEELQHAHFLRFLFRFAPKRLQKSLTNRNVA